MSFSQYFISGSKIYQRLNEWGGKGFPFLFILNFEGLEGYVIPLDAMKDLGIYFQTPGHQHLPDSTQISRKNSFRMEKFPLSLEAYAGYFKKVIQAIHRGETYLLNLTFSTPIHLGGTLQDIFMAGDSPYKLLFQDHFLVFSPEPFIRIRKGRIFSYPMKGTGRIEGAGREANDPIYTQSLNKLLADKKEMAEHATIVDLIRNDLNRVSQKVRVQKYRYAENIRSMDQILIQLSSEISGELPVNYKNNIGTILGSLLPAGSITGAPKKKTVQLIHDIESHFRNYYTGVFGIFDGENLDSAVMIRFLEKQGDQMVFKSGGGITAQSVLEDEYQELIHKIYVPII